MHNIRVKSKAPAGEPQPAPTSCYWFGLSRPAACEGHAGEPLNVSNHVDKAVVIGVYPRHVVEVGRGAGVASGVAALGIEATADIREFDDGADSPVVVHVADALGEGDLAHVSTDGVGPTKRRCEADRGGCWRGVDIAQGFCYPVYRRAAGPPDQNGAAVHEPGGAPDGNGRLSRGRRHGQGVLTRRAGEAHRLILTADACIVGVDDTILVGVGGQVSYQTSCGIAVTRGGPDADRLSGGGGVVVAVGEGHVGVTLRAYAVGVWTAVRHQRAVRDVVVILQVVGDGHNWRGVRHCRT